MNQKNCGYLYRALKFFDLAFEDCMRNKNIESKRMVGVRLSEHKKPVNGVTASHKRDYNRDFDWKNFSTLNNIAITF